MNELNGCDIEDLWVDMIATFSRTITEADDVPRARHCCPRRRGAGHGHVGRRTFGFGTGASTHADPAKRSGVAVRGAADAGNHGLKHDQRGSDQC